MSVAWNDNPYWSSDTMAIYNADLMDKLRDYPDGFFEVMVTDPPYNEVNRASGGLRNLDKGQADEPLVDIPVVAQELARVTSGSLYVWCGFNQVSQWREEFEAMKLSTRVGVWSKTNPSPMNGDKLWLSGVELCVYARKPKAYFNRHCKSPVWTGPTQRLKGHPTPKPAWLMEELIDASCSPGGWVVDPYMGSGSTLIAARNLGRNAVGIDIDPAFCDLAVERLS